MKVGEKSSDSIFNVCFVLVVGTVKREKDGEGRSRVGGRLEEEKGVEKMNNPD
jgi:hypothetical protein